MSFSRGFTKIKSESDIKIFTIILLFLLFPASLQRVLMQLFHILWGLIPLGLILEAQEQDEWFPLDCSIVSMLNHM